jgi:hypothetical protein
MLYLWGKGGGWFSVARAAVMVGAVFNPLALFTALFAATAFSVAAPRSAAVYVAIELVAVGALVVYLLALRARNSSGFWLPVREERLVPAFVLLGLGVATVILLDIVAAPRELVMLTLEMLATASLVTLMVAWIKASAHVAVACHCAVAGVASLGPAGLLFIALVPAIMWARVAERAHTPAEVVVGAAAGTAIATAAVLLL